MSVPLEMVFIHNGHTKVMDLVGAMSLYLSCSKTEAKRLIADDAVEVKVEKTSLTIRMGKKKFLNLPYEDLSEVFFGTRDYHGMEVFIPSKEPVL